MTIKKVSFKNEKGENLSGRLALPMDGNPKNYAVFAHCFTCNKNFNTVKFITQALVEKGFAVLSFDFTGLGESEGEFADSHFSANVQDLVCAANFLKREYKAPALIVGHSLGGAASIFASAEVEEIKAVVTIGAPADPAHVTHLFKDDLDKLKESGRAEVNIGGRSFEITAEFVEELKKNDMRQVLKGLRKSFLFMHSPQDDIVDIKNAAKLYEMAFHPKSFISLDGASHLLMDESDGKYAGKVIADWSERYLHILPENEELPESGVNIITYDGGYTSSVKTQDGHEFIADEPESVGGKNLGPTPYDLLAAALGTCTSMTLRMYAERKKWPLKKIEVIVEHSKIHAKDCDECESKDGKIDRFTRTIKMNGDLDQDQITRLLEIADKCPVHKTLHSEIQVFTQLKK